MKDLKKYSKSKVQGCQKTLLVLAALARTSVENLQVVYCMYPSKKMMARTIAVKMTD
jgi:hypothetical protein